MRERTAYQVDRVVVQNTSRSAFWKPNRASPCKYHTPDPDPDPNRNPNHRDVHVSMRSTWYAVLSRIPYTMMQVRVRAASWHFLSARYTVPQKVVCRTICVQLYSHVLRSISTNALYCRAYNALDSATLHSPVLSISLSSSTALLVCDLSTLLPTLSNVSRLQ